MKLGRTLWERRDLLGRFGFSDGLRRGGSDRRKGKRKLRLLFQFQFQFQFLFRFQFRFQFQFLFRFQFQSQSQSRTIDARLQLAFGHTLGGKQAEPADRFFLVGTGNACERAQTTRMMFAVASAFSSVI